MTAEQRVLVLGRGVLLVDELALPAAIRGSVGAEIIEERVAAEDAAVLQQHHASLPAGDAVQHPDVDRVKPADDAAFADWPRRRDVVIAERRHDRAEHRAGVFDDGTREVPDVALRLAAYADCDCVGTDQVSPARRCAVAPGSEPGDDLAVHIFVSAEMGEGRIAAEHCSGMGVEHAAASAAADVVFDLVQSLHRAPQFWPATRLARLIAVGHQTSGLAPAVFLRPSHHRLRFHPTHVASARLSPIAEPNCSAATCNTAMAMPSPIKPQALLASTAAVGGPPMRGCRISIMDVNTIGNNAMMPLILGPTHPDAVTTVATRVATSAARSGMSYQRRVISGILT